MSLFSYLFLLLSGTNTWLNLTNLIMGNIKLEQTEKSSPKIHFTNSNFMIHKVIHIQTTNLFNRSSVNDVSVS